MSRRALKRAIDSALNTCSGGGDSGSSGSGGSGGDGGGGVACGDVGQPTQHVDQTSVSTVHDDVDVEIWERLRQRSMGKNQP
jgi:hypothetical protein